MSKKPEKMQPNTNWRSRGDFEVDPKDANTVNAIRMKLDQLRQYKSLLAADGQAPDADDKELESELIRQLIRIEKGLPPKKSPQKSGRAKAKAKQKEPY